MIDWAHIRFKNYNFADAKPVNAFPALRKLQAEFRSQFSVGKISPSLEGGELEANNHSAKSARKRC